MPRQHSFLAHANAAPLTTDRCCFVSLMSVQAGRFVTVTLDGCETLTLAEVKVFAYDVTPASAVQI